MEEQCGIDVSERRLDSLDKRILRFALNYKGNYKIAIDIGCGFGRVSAMLALAGFSVYAFDKRELTEHFNNMSNSLSLENKLTFNKKDIQKIKDEDIPKKVSVIIAQRVLHHMPFTQAQSLITKLSKNMSQDGRMFVSLSGLHSEIGKNYKCSDLEVERRFCKLDDNIQKRFRISGPVCLYEEKDATKLFTNTNLKKKMLKKSNFGNIQAVYYNHNGYKYKKLLWKLLQ